MRKLLLGALLGVSLFTGNLVAQTFNEEAIPKAVRKIFENSTYYNIHPVSYKFQDRNGDGILDKITIYKATCSDGDLSVYISCFQKGVAKMQFEQNGFITNEFGCSYPSEW